MKRKVLVISFLTIISVSSVVYGDGILTDDSTMVMKSVTILISFIFVLLLAFLTTKFIGNRTSMIGRGQNITIIEQKNVDKNNKIIIAKILEKYYVILASNNSMTVIETIEDNNSLVAKFNNKNKKYQFNKILKDVVNKKLIKERNNVNKEEEQ